MQGARCREMKIEGQESRCRGRDKTDAKGRRGRMKIEGQESRCKGGARQMQKGEERG
jgi:hypothetical protein